MGNNFDSVVCRLNTNSAKWNVNENVISMSVADMDIQAPNLIINEISRFNQLGIYGYTELPDNYYHIVSYYIHERYKYQVNPEHIIFCPRIIQAISIYIRAFTNQDDGICILTPSYSPILNIIKLNKRNLYECPLIYNKKKYTIDFSTLEECFAKSKVFILISPHNPTGTVWSKATLSKIIGLAKKYHVFIISDDVHADFNFTNKSHCLISSLDIDIAKNSMICTSPSKTFNIPGLEIANVIIENKEIREKFKQEVNALGIHNPNYFSIPAIMSAYKYCLDWIPQLKHYIEENKMITREFLNQHIPLLDISDGDGTYMLWINYQKLHINEDRLAYWLYDLSHIKVSLGSDFGTEGEGFFRINIAMPRTRLLEALNRMKAGFNLLNSKEI